MHYYLLNALPVLILVLAASLAVRLLPRSVLMAIAYNIAIAIAFVLGILTFFSLVGGILDVIDNILF